MAQQIEKSPRAADMPADQKARAIDMQARFAPYFSYCIGGLAPILSALIMGLIYWGAFNGLAGAGMRFGQSLGIAAHASLTGLISAPIGILIMYLKSYGDVDPEHLMATSVGAFLPEGTSKALASIGGSIELFWLWMMFLLATGYSAVSPKKIPFGKAMSIIGGIWVVWVLIKAAFAAVFS